MRIAGSTSRSLSIASDELAQFNSEFTDDASICSETNLDQLKNTVGIGQKSLSTIESEVVDNEQRQNSEKSHSIGPRSSAVSTTSNWEDALNQFNHNSIQANINLTPRSSKSSELVSFSQVDDAAQRRNTQENKEKDENVDEKSDRQVKEKHVDQVICEAKESISVNPLAQSNEKSNQVKDKGSQESINLEIKHTHREVQESLVLSDSLEAKVIIIVIIMEPYYYYLSCLNYRSLFGNDLLLIGKRYQRQTK